MYKAMDTRIPHTENKHALQEQIPLRSWKALKCLETQQESMYWEESTR